MLEITYDGEYIAFTNTLAQQYWIVRTLKCTREEADTYEVVNEDGTPYPGDLYPGKKYFIRKRENV